MTLILASKSQTRIDMLNNAGLVFRSVAAQVDERGLEEQWGNIAPQDAALRLAVAKALNVTGANPDAFVIGADQTLDVEGERLHKPVDRITARHQLLQLRGKTHQLHSAVALCRGKDVLFTIVTTANLTMRDFSSAALDKYLAAANGRETQSVGGYQVEGPAIQLFESIQGDWFTIMGLPFLALLPALRQHGVLPL